MEWNNIPRNAKNIFARKTLTPNSPKLNSSVKETVRGYTAVGLMATALAGVVGQAAFADEEVDPAASQQTTEETADNAAVVRAHSHFGIAQLGEEAQNADSSADQQAGGNGGNGGNGSTDSSSDNTDSGDGQADNGNAQTGNGGNAQAAAQNPGGNNRTQNQQAQPQQAQKNAQQAQNNQQAQGGDRVDRWINQAIGILQRNNVQISQDESDEIRTIIDKESSGDPRAINLWDSNAEKGIPSKGLMQTIDPTFDEHKLAGHDDIYNPVDNIIAGVRYTLDRYGDFEEHPGLSSMSDGGDYQGY